LPGLGREQATLVRQDTAPFAQGPV
jgi:hypothetical protein